MQLTNEEVAFLKKFKEEYEPKFNLLVQKEKDALLSSDEADSKIMDPSNPNRLVFYFSKSEATTRVTVNQQAIKEMYPYNSIPDNLKSQIYKTTEIAPVVKMSYISDDDSDEI